jgi:hypothetical protein
MRFRTRRKWGRMVSGVSACLALMAAAGEAQSAHAQGNLFLDAKVPALTYVDDSTRSNLRSVHGYSDAANHKAWVGARQVGGYVDNFHYACHSYAAGQYLAARIGNFHTVEQDKMQGRYSVEYICSDYSLNLSSSSVARTLMRDDRVAAVPADISERYELFRATPADGMPSDLGEALAPAGALGRNPALARAIDTPYGRGWVLPGHDSICVVVADPADGHATGCTPTAVSAEHGSVLTLREKLGAGAGMGVAVVPDGAAVFLRDRAGRRTALKTEQGVASRLLADGESLEVGRN